MDYNDDILNQITNFGVLGYSIDKIIHLINPEHPEDLKRDILIPENPIYKAYWKGKTTGQYSLDRALFDKATKNNKDASANEQIFERMNREKIADAIFEKFGL